MLLTETISERYGRKTVGEIGLEIEIETQDGFDFPPAPKYWSVHVDGSLRNGLEYSLRNPLSLEELPVALDIWKNSIYNTKCRPSIRTSVHVHFNVIPYTVLQVLNIISVYWLLENVILRYAGNYREGNLFCLRIKDADQAVDNITSQLSETRFDFANFGEGNYKYAALNIASVARLGSLEFRGLQGIYDPVMIMSWVKLHHKLIHEAISFSNPKEILKFYEQSSVNNFCSRFLTPEFVQILPTLSPTFVNLIKENLGYLIEVAQSHKTFTDEGIKKKQKRKPKPWEEPFNVIIDEFGGEEAEEIRHEALIEDDRENLNWRNNPEANRFIQQFQARPVIPEPAFVVPPDGWIRAGEMIRADDTINIVNNRLVIPRNRAPRDLDERNRQRTEARTRQLNQFRDLVRPRGNDATEF